MSSSREVETRGRFRGRAAEIRRNRFLAPAAIAARLLGPAAVASGAASSQPGLLLLSPLFMIGGIVTALFAISQNPCVRTFVDSSYWRKQKWLGIELVLRSGATVRIPVSSQQTLQQSNRDLIRERIREAMESHRLGDAAAETALLARQARSVSDWVQSLRAIGSGAHVDHRTAPVAPERLFRIVEDPSLTASARAGAAVALGASLDASGKVRLKDAAGATAAPKLRIAIEAAASGDDAALIEALSAIEGEAEKRAQV
jgi:hypothetical protein